MTPRPSAGRDYSSLATAPNGLACARCVAMPGVDSAMMTSPRMVASSSAAMISNVTPDSARSR